MIRSSAAKGHETHHATVVVAFDRASGQVFGTYVHGSLGGLDAAGLARGRERLLADIAWYHGRNAAAVDTLEVPLHEVPLGGIERVDPKTRRIETKSAVADHAAAPATPLTRP
jgi:hypothetical protein